MSLARSCQKAYITTLSKKTRVDQGANQTLTYLKLQILCLRRIIFCWQWISARLLASKVPANLGRSREFHGSTDLLRVFRLGAIAIFRKLR